MAQARDDNLAVQVNRKTNASMKFPRRAIIAPSHDIRQTVEVEFKSSDEIRSAQRERYEIIKWLDGE